MDRDSLWIVPVVCSFTLAILLSKGTEEMKTKVSDVKSKSVVVGQADYEVFDSVPEAIDFLGEAVVLDLINSQHRTNKLNAVRAAATGKPSKSSLKLRAMSELTVDELISIAGDPNALERLLDKKIAEMEEAIEAAATTSPATSNSEDDEAEDEN